MNNIDLAIKKLTASSTLLGLLLLPSLHNNTWP